MIIKKEDIINLINLCFDATNESKLGEFGSVLFKGIDGQIQGNQTLVHLFLSLVSALCPKGTIIGEMTMKEEKENWEKDD